MPFGRTRVRHRLDHLVLGGQKGGTPLRLTTHRAVGVKPIMPRVVAGRRPTLRRSGYADTLWCGGWHHNFHERVRIEGENRMARKGNLAPPLRFQYMRHSPPTATRFAAR